MFSLPLILHGTSGPALLRLHAITVSFPRPSLVMPSLYEAFQVLFSQWVILSERVLSTFVKSPLFCADCIFGSLLMSSESRDSVVGIATGYGLVSVRVPVGSRIFFSPRRPDRLWGPPSLLANGQVKRPGREADHSPPTSVEVKKMWVYISTLLYVFMA
jgi:hypothetical protein